MKRIPDYPNYAVDTFGNVFSLRKSKPRQLKPGLRGKGYLHVILSQGTKNSRKSFSVHRLVAEAFIPNPHNLSQVNHKDGNKLNNAVDNLEWANNSHNTKHAHTAGLNTSPKGFKARRAKLTKELIVQIHNESALGTRQVDIAAMTGISQPVVSQVIRKVRDWYDPSTW